ncbi:MAG: TIGR00374 family protein, partial [Bacteroidia bacterium]|nr:TIGR00374 family protein [Bacteroidia bacterium]
VLIGFIAGGFAIAASNGGVFVYPAAILAAFSLFGLDENPSFAFGWIMWTAQSALILFFGALSFLFLPILNREK